MKVDFRRVVFIMGRCLSVCLSHAGILSKRLHISSNFFAPSGSPTILVFHTKQDGNTPTGTPLTGASNARYATVSHTLCNYALHVQQCTACAVGKFWCILLCMCIYFGYDRRQTVILTVPLTPSVQVIQSYQRPI